MINAVTFLVRTVTVINLLRTPQTDMQANEPDRDGQLYRQWKKTGRTIADLSKVKQRKGNYKYKQQCLSSSVTKVTAVSGFWVLCVCMCVGVWKNVCQEFRSRLTCFMGQSLLAPCSLTSLSCRYWTESRYVTLFTSTLSAYLAAHSH